MRTKFGLLAAFCLSGAAGMLSAQSGGTIRLSSAVTTRQPLPGNACTAPPAETNFLTTDYSVWVVFSYTGGLTTDTGYLEWFDPSGNIYTTFSIKQGGDGGTWCWYYYIGIAGYPPGSTPGAWRVRLRWNDTEVFSRPFTIAAPPAGAITLVSNSLLPQGTVGAAYQYTLQAAGGKPPYQWSLASGGFPPGLTMSSGGVVSGTPTTYGSYIEGIKVADSGGATLNQDVSLAVAYPAFSTSVGSLAYTYTQGGPAAASQTVALSTNGGSISFQASTNQTWFSVTPTTGRTPANLVVAVNPQGLAPGSYQGAITLRLSGASTDQVTIPVSLAVLAGGSSALGGIINTVAGTDWTFTIPGGKGVNAPLGFVVGMAADAKGNLFVPDGDNNVVVRLAPDGTASVVAGNGFFAFSGDGGAALNASLASPWGIAVDGGGNLYITDHYNHRIRKVATDGTITTIAGTGRNAFGGDGGQAIVAQLSYPTDIVVDGSGNIIFYDSGNARMRRITPDGVITTIAGNGKYGYSGEGAALQVAIDSEGRGMAIDASGNLYFGDSQSHVRKITSAGQTVLVAGSGTFGFSGDNGPATKANLKDAFGIAVDSAGNVYFGDFNNGRIRKVDNNGVITTFAGSGSIVLSGDGGPALKAGLNPTTLVMDSAGRVCLSDTFTVIRCIDASQTINSVMGNQGYKNVSDGTPASTAFFRTPQGLTTDAAGNLLVADGGASRIRKVTTNGAFTTIAGLPGVGGCCFDGKPALQALILNPIAMAVDTAGNIYFADRDNHRIRKISTTGIMTTVAGSGDFSEDGAYDGDGALATSAHLNLPHGVAVDKSGNIYIADEYNHAIRKVDTSGKISTIAGNGQPGSGGDGGPANKAQLHNPVDVMVDSTGKLYIADRFNYKVRVVDTAGIITTFAGTGNDSDSGDGGQATRASLNWPSATARDAAGNVYISEYFGNRIRRVSPDGIISTIAGTGVFGFGGDGGPSTVATIGHIDGNMVVANGVLYFTDSSNDRVRAIQLTQVAAPTLNVSPASLSFSAFSNGAASASNPVAVSSSSFGLPFQVAANTASGGNWLTAAAVSTTSPGTVAVSANPAGLAAGTYQGTVSVLAGLANPPKIDIPVTFTVKPASAGHLTVDSTPLSHSLLTGAAAVTDQVAVRNTGSGTIGFQVTTKFFSGGSSWLTVSPSSGSVSASAASTVTIAVNPGNMAAGVYSANVTVSSPDTSDPAVTVPVTLVLSNPVPVILVSQTGLTFRAVQGAGTPLAQSIAILNIGQGSMNWTATTQVLSGSGWLSISQPSGTVSRPYLDFSTVDVKVNTSGLAAGNYFGQIQVRAAGASNAPQTVAIVVNVLPPGSTLGPEVRPTGLLFIGNANSGAGSQTVSIANRGTSNATYNSSRLTLSGLNWFAHVPVVGSVAVNSPGQITVQPDFTSRTPGVDYGTITLLFNDGTSQTISILSVVPPSGSRSEGVRPLTSSNCNQLLMQVTNPAADQNQLPHASVGQPMTLEAQLTDNCGNTITRATSGAAVKANFSTGEPSVTLQNLNGGKWSATWQPRNKNAAQSIVTITAFASGPNGIPIGQQKDVTIALDSGAPVPLVQPGGIVNAASSSPAPLVAPGGLISIYGSLLADPGGQTPNTVPIPTQLAGAQVRLGDQLLPLFYSSDQQLNVQVPFNLPVNTDLQLVVQHGNTISVPATITVATSQPAIFTKNQQGTGQGIILKSDQVTLAQPGTPASVGEALVIYCTGLGPVTPAVAAGAAAPASPLSNTSSPVTVQIGGRSAQVLFAGLTPGFAGLYQVNAIVPQGVAAGNTVPVSLQVAGQTSPEVTMAVK